MNRRRDANAVSILEDLAQLYDRVSRMNEREKESLGKLLDDVYVAIVESEDERVPASLRDLPLSAIDMFQGLRLVLDSHHDFDNFPL